MKNMKVMKRIHSQRMNADTPRTFTDYGFTSVPSVSSVVNMFSSFHLRPSASSADHSGVLDILDSHVQNHFSNQSPVTSHQSPVTSHQSPVTSYQLPVTSYQLPVTSYQSPVTSHQSPVTSHQSPVTSHQSPVTSHQSHHEEHEGNEDNT